MFGLLPVVAFALAGLCSHASAQAVAEQGSNLRVWTSQVGTKIEARLKSVIGNKVVLEKEDGAVLEVPLTSLSPDDQAWVARQTKPVVASAPKVSPGGIVIPADFPVDEKIEGDPLLKRRRAESWTLSFTDAVTKKQVSAASLKGKVVYVHSLDLSSAAGASVLQSLKALHDKYAKRGFEIVTLHTFLNPPDSAAESLTRKAVFENAKKLREDIGIEWSLMVHDKGWNPLTEKLSGQQYLRHGWLIDPDGRLLHSRVVASSSTKQAGNERYLTLASALAAIFPE